ncbi:DegV family protein [Anaerofustis stercorihominis]|uniref:DegV family protein n=1 Tax=Anaerofustis stercorihominis TaxID=214853 RepID=UPI001105BCBB|nr:DegV family protein [Anaerofustis stercorihominis]
MSVKILTDSSSDYEAYEIKEKNIEVVPIAVSFGEEHYLDGVDLDKDTFYKKLESSSEFPKTAQPTPNEFLEYFNKAKENNDDLVVILLSSGLSGTVQSANIAKDMCEYDNIFIIDSVHAVTGVRMLVDSAIKLRDEGKSGKEIYNEILVLTTKVRSVVMVDTLEYLHKGGRLTKAQATLGEAVNMKPIISIDELGKLYMKDKSLGKTRAYKKIIKLFKSFDIDTSYPVYFPYSNEKSNCEELVKKLKAMDIDVDEKYMYNIGPTVGAHLGSGTFGFTMVVK